MNGTDRRHGPAHRDRSLRGAGARPRGRGRRARDQARGPAESSPRRRPRSRLRAHALVVPARSLPTPAQPAARASPDRRADSRGRTVRATPLPSAVDEEFMASWPALAGRARPAVARGPLADRRPAWPGPEQQPRSSSASAGPPDELTRVRRHPNRWSLARRSARHRTCCPTKEMSDGIWKIDEGRAVPRRATTTSGRCSDRMPDIERFMQQLRGALPATVSRCDAIEMLCRNFLCPGNVNFSQRTLDEYSGNARSSSTEPVTGLGGDFVNAFPVPPGKKIRLTHRARPGYTPTKIRHRHEHRRGRK
jgi:hypothetical protein